MDAGVRRLLERIVGEMDGCDCNSHSVRFDERDLKAAKAALAVCRGCSDGLALIYDIRADGAHYYHMSQNGAAVPHTGEKPQPWNQFATCGSHENRERDSGQGLQRARPLVFVGASR